MHLEYGKTRLLASGSVSMEQQFTARSDRVSFALFIPELTGTLDVQVWTSEAVSPAQLVCSFEQQTGPTTSYLTLLSPILVTAVKVIVTLNGTGSFFVYGKAVSGVGAADSGESSSGAGATHQVLDEVLMETGAEMILGDNTELAIVPVGQDKYMQIPASNTVIWE